MGSFQTDMTVCLTVTTYNPEQTQAVGKTLGSLAYSGDVFLLTGTLGSGKTCLTQGIAWGMGITEYPRSPTFVLVHQYHGKMVLYHIDLYRLDESSEVIDMGIEEYLESDGVCVIEWAEKAIDVLPTGYLWIKIDETGDNMRRLTFQGIESRHVGLVEDLSKLLEIQRKRGYRCT